MNNRPQAQGDKEKNFVSAVVYLRDDEPLAAGFFTMLRKELSAHFAHYEVVCVDDGCKDGTLAVVRGLWEEGDAPLTVVRMGLRQGREAAMNAGLDMAVGDFLYEFDTLETPYDPGLVFKAYQTCLAGHDIVSVSPEKNRNTGSRLFYRLFNRASGAPEALHTDAFRLVSRRALNRVRAVSDRIAYRKAAYAASGLSAATLTFPGSLSRREEGRGDLAVNSLVLYTAAAYKMSLALALCLLAVSLCELVYTVVIWATRGAVTGWTTTMFAMTLGFSGVFLMLAIVVKYLSILVDLVFKKQSYLVEGVEKR